MRFVAAPQARSRSTNFCTLPVDVFGSGPNSTSSGTLEVRQPLAAVGDQLGRGHLAAVAQRHVRLRALAPLLVRDGDHRALQHRRV